jgi:hypothetical protein
MLCRNVCQFFQMTNPKPKAVDDRGNMVSLSRKNDLELVKREVSPRDCTCLEMVIGLKSGRWLQIREHIWPMIYGCF